MSEKPTLMEHVTNFFSLVPLILYTIVALMLTVIAIVSVWDSAILVWHLVFPTTVPVNIIDIINSLLLTITIIVLFETVAIYFRTKQVDVRILLIAGLTGMVRHILVYNVGSIDPAIMFATVALLAVLIAGVVFIKPGNAT
jgi:uncharacterized membrane protein (DUF373 family)